MLNNPARRTARRTAPRRTGGAPDPAAPLASILAMLAVPVTSPLDLSGVAGRTVLVVIAHADDATLFCGGLIRSLADVGSSVHVLRVTDDRWDSTGLPEDVTIERNRREFEEAMAVLGVARIHELGYRTDHMAEVSETALRTQLIAALRQVRPTVVIGFDPDSVLFEDNEDHRVTARALAEAVWCAGFDKHGPAGTAVFIPAQRWYFGRVVALATHHLDVTDHATTLVAAAGCHREMMRNMAQQALLRAQAAGIALPGLDSSAGADLTGFVEFVVSRPRRRDGGLQEVYRVIGDGDLRELAEHLDTRTPPATDMEGH